MSEPEFDYSKIARPLDSFLRFDPLAEIVALRADCRLLLLERPELARGDFAAAHERAVAVAMNLDTCLVARELPGIVPSLARVPFNNCSGVW